MPSQTFNFDTIKLKEQFLNAVPMGIALLNPDFDVVYANETFEKMFGAWKNQKCFFVYKKRESLCSECAASKVFKDGRARTNLDVQFVKDEHTIHYIKHIIPVVYEDGTIPFIVEMWTDITKTEQMRKEHQILFDQVPCNVFLLDKDFRIVKVNERVIKHFGDIEGQYCFEALKGLKHQCAECTAHKSFIDGKMHTGLHTWTTDSGKEFNFQVSTIPLKTEDEKFDMVIETAMDVTQTLKLEKGLNFANSFMKTIIGSSIDSIFAVDASDNVTIVNSAARNLFDVDELHQISKEDLEAILPDGILDQVSQVSDSVYLPEAEIQTMQEEKIPVRLFGSKLFSNKVHMGMAFSVQDLREIKQLEWDKLEAERLAAVGQTVAGLAHGVKNLITALEGGMYMLNTGMKKNEIQRVQKGMDMLQRNTSRISEFVKAFLSFSKGRTIQVKPSNPGEIAKEVVELYSVEAQKLGIKLINQQQDELIPASIDYESMHECLTNLVGNAIDACRMSEVQGGPTISVLTFEKDGIITYEVSDNGSGMEYDVKGKVFTTFFTTKGLGGSGLGLLMTKKIVQEHGGRIEVESEAGKGSVFRIILPRNKLPKTIENDE